MSDVVIRAEGLGKRYLIGHETERESYVALRDVIARSARNLARSAGDLLRGRQLLTGNEIEEFWALKDVNFEIKRGEVVGIIGRNGAGKSTLLKILSRITEPTTGRVEILGRVASLLEVGTGFHPELTGRENIFLNGAILGMSRAEIKRKFDEIVDFAEVEKFLDTPVKRYSSGMYVRLAFAVAAHLEPEILIVDEVLAVGDAEFQKKCLGKMKDVAGGGRTVLFVSHNIAAIQALCSNGLYLNGGTLALSSSASEAITAYASSAPDHHDADLSRMRNRRGSGRAVFTDMRFEPEPRTGQPLDILLRLDSETSTSQARCSVMFSDQQGRPVALFSSELTSSDGLRLERRTTIRCRIPRFPLPKGKYLVDLFVEVNGSISDWIEQGMSVLVEDGDYFGTGRNLPHGWSNQVALIDHSWSYERAIDSAAGVLA